MFGKIIGNLRLAAIIGAVVLLLGSSAATIGLGSVALADHDKTDLDGIESGNLIINYIYEIELENSDSPQIELDRNTVEQGDDFAVNGSNFHDDSTVGLSIFEEQLLSITDEQGDLAERSAAVLLTKADVAMSEDNGGSISVENDETVDAGNNGTVVLVTNISPSDVSSREYDLNLECEAGPDEETNFEFPDQLVLDNSSSKQFFELSLPAGDYEQCQIVMSPGGNDATVESSMMDFTVAAGDVASVNGTTTNGEGSFAQDITVAFDAEPGRYVLMAETNSDDDSKKAIAPLRIVDEETSVAGGEQDDDDKDSSAKGTGSDIGSEGGATGGSNSGDTGGSNNGGDNTGGSNPPGSGPQGPTPPAVDNCQEVALDSGNVNNTIIQSSSQSASNSYTDDDVINVVQKISGTYNGTGYVNTGITIDDSNTVTQRINQDIDQDATIKECGSDQSNAGGNQTNTIDMNATQLASNAYSDNTTIIIVQTIIIPKYCNTNVNAPISISDRDTVTQTIDQDVDQNGEITYGSGGSGEGGSSTNTVTQTSMQVAGNNATNDQVITINQVVIVPPDCPVEVSAPVVIEGNDNVQMTVNQTSGQDANIDSSGGVTVSSSVSTGEQPTYTTNTVVMVGSQEGQNSFSDNDTIIIEQNIYYVNDTAGWTDENYEEKLAEEFGNSTNSTSSSNSTTLDAEGGPTSSEDNSTAMAASSLIIEDTAPPGNGNSSDTSDEEGSVDAAASEESGNDAGLKDSTDNEDPPPSSYDNSTDAGSSGGDSSASGDSGSDEVTEESGNAPADTSEASTGPVEGGSNSTPEPTEDSNATSDLPSDTGTDTSTEEDGSTVESQQPPESDNTSNSTSTA